MKCLTHDTATCRPSGAKVSKIQDTASIVGAGFPRPTGWVTQLRIQPVPFSALSIRAIL